MVVLSFGNLMLFSARWQLIHVYTSGPFVPSATVLDEESEFTTHPVPLGLLTDIMQSYMLAITEVFELSLKYIYQKLECIQSLSIEIEEICLLECSID